MDASCIFADETALIVICPYCAKLHRHGAGAVPGARTAHCGKGEYMIGDVFSDSYIAQAFKQYKTRLGAKRAAPKE